MKKTVAIIGSGKIGRGYLADLFSAAGYHITFIDISTDLVDRLNSRGQYTLFITGKSGTKKRIIKDYSSLIDFAKALPLSKHSSNTSLSGTKIAS